MNWSDPQPMEEIEFPAGTELDGRYLIRSLLGEGGMGCVYLAEDMELGQDVALKILVSRYRGRPEREQRLLNEIKVARRVGEHPNIPRLYGTGRLHDLEGCPYVAWEVVEGRDINTLLMLRRIPPRVAVAWARQLADVLCVMHRAGVVHRDVTVTNVFVEDPDGEPVVKLIDFSHAALLPRRGMSSRRLTQELEVPGTHRAMPPEQAMAAPAHPKMDVFAFGVLLHEMLTGRNPFGHVQHRETYIELQCAGRLEVPRIDRRVHPEVPEGLVDLVAACTRNEMEQRLDMDEVLHRLDAMLLLMSGPVLVTPDASAPVFVEERHDEAPPVLDDLVTAPVGETAGPQLPRTEPASSRVAPAEMTTKPSGAAVDRGQAPEADRPRRLRPVVIAAAALSVLVAGLLLAWPSEEPARAEPREEVEPTRTPPGRASVEHEPVRAREAQVDEPSAAEEPTSPPPEVNAPAEDPETPPSRPVASKRKPRRTPKTPAHETEACREAVESALTANRSQAWSRVETLTRKRKCFGDRSQWANLRVRALYETGRLAECIALAHDFENPVVQKYATICTAQQGNP